MSLRLMVGASPRLAPTMNFVHLRLKVIFSMFADFSQISILVSRTCLFSLFSSHSFTISITSI